MDKCQVIFGGFLFPIFLCSEIGDGYHPRHSIHRFINRCISRDLKHTQKCCIFLPSRRERYQAYDVTMCHFPPPSSLDNKWDIQCIPWIYVLCLVLLRLHNHFSLDASMLLNKQSICQWCETPWRSYDVSVVTPQSANRLRNSWNARNYLCHPGTVPFIKGSFIWLCNRLSW